MAYSIYELLRMEMLAVKYGSSLTAIARRKGVTSDDPWATGNVKDGLNKTAQGTRFEKIEEGKIMYLDGTEDISMFNSNRPSPTFNGFIETLVREVSNSFELPFGFTWNMAGMGGVISRFDSQQAHRVFQRFQSLIAEKILVPAKDLIIANGIAQRKIRPHKQWKLGKFTFPAHITGDIGYQTSADILLMANGLKNGTEIYAERGLDFYEETETLAREINVLKQMATKYGIPIELLAMQRVPNATQSLAAVADANTPPEPLSINDIGHQGVASMTKILTDVASGNLPRESAIMTLLTMYKLDEQTAQAIVPEFGSSLNPKPLN
jgi:hypothetical protein